LPAVGVAGGGVTAGGGVAVGVADVRALVGAGVDVGPGTVTVNAGAACGIGVAVFPPAAVVGGTTEGLAGATVRLASGVAVAVGAEDGELEREPVDVRLAVGVEGAGSPAASAAASSTMAGFNGGKIRGWTSRE
jgi:hypothetical protein